MAGIAAGRCRYCRCTEDNACTLPDGDCCSWFDRERTVCTNPACVTALFAARQKQEALKYHIGRKRTPGEVSALIAAEKKATRQVANAKYRARMKVKKAAAKAGGAGTRGIA